MSTYSVYVHENLINGKKYIGITSQKPSYRWGKNGSNYKFQSKFFNAIKKSPVRKGSLNVKGR